MTRLSRLSDLPARILRATAGAAAALWSRYRALSPRLQWIIAALLLVGVIFLFTLGGSSESGAADTPPAVSLEAVGALSGGNGASSFFGSVESVSEAEIIAKASGTVTRVNARIGQSVGAGAILASLENASESAAVLSAQGAYEAALAARSISGIQSAGTEDAARNAVRSAYAAVDTALRNSIDPYLSGPERIPGITADLSDKRWELGRQISAWRIEVNGADSRDPGELFPTAEDATREAAAFVESLARTANASNSGASASARAGIASARASISATENSLASARAALEVARRQSDSSSGATATADATVKQALGALRSAEAAYERTVIRAPIAGTVNYLPIKVGDYVAAMTHAATVARNAALEITAFVSPDAREAISVGAKVVIDEKSSGTITSIAPALDPITKQIEVRVAADDASSLVNGQSVRMRLESAPKTEVSAGPLLLPLSSVKMSSGSRSVFSVGEDSRLVAHPVEVGAVRGDRIEVATALPLDLLVVRDARGLSAGQLVRVSAGN